MVIVPFGFPQIEGVELIVPVGAGFTVTIAIVLLVHPPDEVAVTV